MNEDTHDNIVKAQALYRRLTGCATAQDFKKIFGEAIQQHTLDEFYLVVVRAEYSAALVLCDTASKQGGGDFSPAAWMLEFCGLKPGHLIGQSVQAIADISEKPLSAITGMLERFSFEIRDGVVSGHPEAVTARRGKPGKTGRHAV